MEQLSADTSLGRSLAAARGNQHGPCYNESCITLNSLTEAMCAKYFFVDLLQKVNQLPNNPKNKR